MPRCWTGWPAHVQFNGHMFFSPLKKWAKDETLGEKKGCLPLQLGDAPGVVKLQKLDKKGMCARPSRVGTGRPLAQIAQRSADLAKRPL